MTWKAIGTSFAAASNLGHRIKGSLAPLDDQKTGHAAEKLIRHRSVIVHVVPIGAGRMIFGDVDFYLVGLAGSHFPENIVGHAQRRNRQTVSVKVERIFVMREVVIPFVRRVEWQVIDEEN